MIMAFASQHAFVSVEAEPSTHDATPAVQPRRARPVRGRAEFERLMAAVAETRSAVRNRAIVLLSFDGGLRMSEIERLRRHHVLHPGGGLVQTLVLDPEVSKRTPWRSIVLGKRSRLRTALLQLVLEEPGEPDDPLIRSERNGPDGRPRPMSQDSLAFLFYRLYRRAGLEGCSSFSGRRTHIMGAMASVPASGGSLRDAFAKAGLRHAGAAEPYADVRPAAGQPQLQLFE